MKIRLLQHALAVLMMMTFISFNLYAQEGADNPLGAADTKTKVFVGPVVGYNSVMHSTEKLATFSDTYCPSFEGGTGQGFFFGLTYEYHFGKAEETISSIIGRVMYSMYPGSMDIAGDDFPSLVPDPQSAQEVSIVRSSTKHIAEIDYNVLAIEVMYKQNISQDFPLGLTAGPTIEIPLTKNILQQYQLVTPDNVTFSEVAGYQYSDDLRTVTTKDGEIVDASGVRIGLKLGLQYEIIVAESWYIVPAVYYNFSLLNVKSDEDYRINAFQVGIDLRYALGF